MFGGSIERGALPLASMMEGALGRCHVSELDHLGEEVAYLKFWLGIVVVTDISLAGWLISSSDTAASYTVFFAILGLAIVGLSAA
jgi:hypothetical protein